MHTREQTLSGIPGVGDMAWGTHCCHFYDSADDLADTLVPFFKAGIDANEACVWVTSEPFSAVDARAALGTHVHDLEARERSGQIEIVDYRSWYLRSGNADAPTTLQGWLAREEHALRNGRRGLRLTGNMHWLERDDWPSFIQYEELVNETFRHRQIVGMCSYCLGRCLARDVVEVVKHHDFTLARYGNQWQVVESASMALAREDLRRTQAVADRLQLDDHRKDEFMAILSHELRNPLAPIATASQLMRMRGAVSDYDKELSIIDRQVRHLTRLIDDLLDVSRITRGKIELRREPAELSELVSRALEMTVHLLEQGNHSLKLSVPTGIVVEVDSDRIVQVLQNLLTNAARYTPAGGTISVTATQVDGRAELTVADNGPGISLALQARVFEPFVQGERSLDRREGGLGLGLPIVKSLVELHGGSVALSSSAQAGTTITIQLNAPSASQPKKRTEAAPLAQAHGRILIVDDNEDAAEVLELVLQRCGYVVKVAHDGATALQLAAAFEPDAALLDIGLPNMDGFELALRLRKLPELQNIKLIAISGYGSASERSRAQKNGFEEHFAKPVELPSLLRALRTLLPDLTN